MQMLMKFEAKSSRVKGLAFHPTRPWVLASLHSGQIVLYDYLVGTQIDHFDEHDGPVRGVDFHCTQPLFCSGGDDYKVKVWNYKQRRCLFTLYGHLDYVRTVRFHREYPWLVSASDDQTIRIWNWQSRQSVGVLNGHNHYVMCACFHPTEDLVISASLDTTVRVWDVSGLRKKRVSRQAHSIGQSLGQSDLFVSESVVKFVLEGHDRGVNWVTCHPALPLIASAADDRMIKIWRMNQTRAWEVDTLRGHFNNVSSVLFHPRQQMLISNSEDRSIRVWDLMKKVGIQTFRREKDRFWILASHPSQNLFAAGHDSGLIVFKIERERPAYCLTEAGTMFYVKDKIVRAFDLEANSDSMVVSVKKGGVRSMTYNMQEHAALFQYVTSDSKHYEFYKLPSTNSQENVHSKRGSGLSAAFISRNRFAVLDSSGTVSIKNFANEVTKTVRLPTASVDALFPASSGRVLLRTPEGIFLWNIQGGKNPLGEISAPGIKYVFWSADHKFVALLSRRTIYLANRELHQLCSVNETIRVKSGAWWDTHGIFIYSTHTHLKYLLSNGDSAIIHTLKRPMYIVGVQTNKVIVLDRECKVSTLHIDFTEMAFKKAVVDGDHKDVFEIIRRSRILGKSIIGYLEKKGYPEIALHFVTEPHQRFKLALECKLLDHALEAARSLDESELWSQLAEAALAQGHFEIVELCYERNKDVEKLEFFYLITGNIEGLKKLSKIAQLKGDVANRFQTALYLGDAGERAQCLKEVGQTYLAYTCAVAHGLEEQASGLQLSFEDGTVPEISARSTLKNPPLPVSSSAEWELPPMRTPMFNQFQSIAEKAPLSPSKEEEARSKGWEEEVDFEMPKPSAEPKLVATPVDSQPDLGAGWDSFADVDLPVAPEAESVEEEPARDAESELFLPTGGQAVEQLWCENSGLASAHVSSGNFESGMKILNRQIGLVNFAPLRPYFLMLKSSSCSSLPSLPGHGLVVHPLRKINTSVPRESLPVSVINVPVLEDLFKQAYQTTSSANFSLARDQFREVLLRIPLASADTEAQVGVAKELISTCREYVSGLNMELARREVQGKDPVRAAELAIYFARCDLRPFHHCLTLNLAMSGCARIKNFEHACHFARLLLEANALPQHAKQARDIIHACGTNPKNEHELQFDETKLFSTCQMSFTPIYKGTSSVLCPYCGAHFLEEHTGKLCPVCTIAEIGRDASGLKISSLLH